MEQSFVLQGRVIGDAELGQVRHLLRSHAEWSRYRLSRELCSLWAWRAPNGQMQDMAARSLLLKLEQRGLVVLPPKRWASPNRMLHKKLRPVDHGREPIHETLASLAPLEVVELSRRSEDLALFEWLLHQHHYLGYASAVGLNLKYLVRDRHGRPLSCLLFGSAAWKCAPRDQFVGWSPAARETRLQAVTNNTRFVILPRVLTYSYTSSVVGCQSNPDCCSAGGTDDPAWTLAAAA